MSVAEARRFVLDCFRPGETIALLLRHTTEPHIRQRIITREQALVHRYLGWLRHENANGTDIYIAANPLFPGSRKRTKESVAEVRHLYLDLDQDGDRRIAALLASSEVPRPTCILSTSPGKYQVLYAAQNSREPRTERWLLSVTYYLNPKQVSDQAEAFPQFETINPLGLTITEFHENRVSVDLLTSATATENAASKPALRMIPCDGNTLESGS